jgi:hypothetical protein
MAPVDVIARFPDVPEPVICGVDRFVVKVGEALRTTDPVPVEEEMLMVGVAPPEEASGAEAETDVTVPVPGGDGVVQERVVPLEVRT